MLKEALSQIVSTFEHQTLMKGRQLQMEGAVLNPRMSEGLVHARIRDNNRVFDLYCDLKNWPDKKAQCSCHDVKHCAHFAATLFALQEKSGLKLLAPIELKLNEAFIQWLDALKQKETDKNKKTHVITYHLHLDALPNALSVSLGIAKMMKTLTPGKPKFLQNLTPKAKSSCTPLDEEIISHLLFNAKNPGVLSRLSIQSSEMLNKILQTRNCYTYPDNKLVNIGTPKKGDCVWRVNYLGQERLCLTLLGQEIKAPLLLTTPWVYDEEEQTFFEIQHPYSHGFVLELLRSPPIEIENAAAIREALEKQYNPMPQPLIYDTVIEKKLTPTPVLVFDKITLVNDTSKWYEEDFEQTYSYYAVFLNYKYQDIEIPASFAADFLWSQDGTQVIKIQRNRLFEEIQYNLFTQLLSIRPFSPKELEMAKQDLMHGFVLTSCVSESDIESLHQRAIPRLKEEGFLIRYQAVELKETLKEEDLEWFEDLNDTETNAFFAYALGFNIDGERVSLVPLVVKLINTYGEENITSLTDDQRLKLDLPDGRRIDVAASRVKPIIALLLELGQGAIKGDGLKMSRYQMLLLHEAISALKANAKRWVGSEHLKDRLTPLMHTVDAHCPVPVSLNANLRSYQMQGLNWLQWIRQAELGGVLADDMGLGKTIQTIAHLLIEKESGRLTMPALIVAPTSLMGNWRYEIERFAPSLRVLIYYGAERQSLSFENVDIIVTTYGLLQRDKKRFIEEAFYYLILDEAQCIKNAKTKTTLIVQQIKARHRLCLSGTPLENHLEELWSLFNFLMPGFLGDVTTFRRIFRFPIEKEGDVSRQKILARRVRPFMLRRTKQEVVKELPPKTEMTQTVRLEGGQRELYETIRMSMEKKVREAITQQGLGRSHIVLLDALLKMRQVCCDPRLVKLERAQKAHGQSAKLELLMTLVENLVEEGRYILIFSQFVSMLELIEEELKSQKVGYLKLTGKTQNRQDVVDRFQKGEAPIFLISLKAGGTGLNLTRADTVIHYDPWWNPATEDQATDRAHRIGQDNPVFVYKLIAEGTVEEAMLKLQEKKRELYAGVFASKGPDAPLITEADFVELFKPLS